NTSDSPVQLSITAESASASVTIPADGQVRFEDEDNATTLEAAGAEPGALVPVTLRVNSESAKVGVPVLDGSLAEYPQYLETPPPAGSPTEGATAEPTAPTTEDSPAPHAP
ncbi:hypothetical protein HER39_19950, partial [Arthrobacter deserti]|nr:hypothetical protein [Arthrobacter deserti]